MKSIAVLSVVHNASKYLPKAIDSVLKQTYPNFTYYICNNGSTDDTADIIHTYMAQDQRIVYLENNENIYDQAYNKSLKETISGNYDYFFSLDGDDFLEVNALEILMNLVDHDKEIIIGGSRAIYYENNKVNSIKTKGYDYGLNQDEYREYMEDIYPAGRTMWGKLYSMDLIRSVKHLESMSYGADTLFFLEALSKSERIVFAKEIIYNYVLHTSSVSNVVQESRVHAARDVYNHSLELFERMNWNSNDNILYLMRVYLYSTYETLDLLRKEKNSKNFHLINEILNEPELGLTYNAVVNVKKENDNQLVREADLAFRTILNNLAVDAKESLGSKQMDEESLLLLKAIALYENDLKIYVYCIKILANIYSKENDAVKLRQLQEEVALLESQS